MEHWVISKSTDEAAAFATLGMPIRVLRGVEMRAGKPNTHFGIGMVNVEGTEKTKKVQNEFKSGKLARNPWHPYLVIRLAFENRNKILDLANRGVKCHLEGGEMKPGAYVASGVGLPGLSAAVPAIKTGDLKVAAALSVCGLKLLHIEGATGERVFYVQAMGRHRGVMIDAGALIRAWRKDPESVPWEHAFAQAMRGMQTRERLLDVINRSNLAVTVLQHRGPKSAVVIADAKGNVSDAAMESVGEFFEN